MFLISVKNVSAVFVSASDAWFLRGAWYGDMIVGKPLAFYYWYGISGVLPWTGRVVVS